ncbi:MAG: hypothetical protein HPAVJP_5780 [Candidatus Hepatoplasma vulgare]|nr:MAG: hypothetical protein HPAVJP_5780 [Candidatus Hepatoplasma sp.]
MEFFKTKNILDDHDKEVIIHENPFTVFFILKNTLYMKIKSNSKKISLHLILNNFIKEYKNSKNQQVLNEVEFKISELKNILPFSQYKLEAIRFAFSKFFFSLLILSKKGLIKDTNVDFGNSSIENKYEFIFKNLGENFKIIKTEDTLSFTFDFSRFKGKELKRLKKTYKDAGIKNFEKKKKRFFFKKRKKNKFFKVKNIPKKEDEHFYLIKVKPRTLKARFNNDLGEVAIKGFFKKRSFFYDIEKDSRFFLITKKNYEHLKNEVLDKNSKKITMFKIHFDPLIYFNDYYDITQILDYNLFEYHVYKLDYKYLKYVKFVKPKKIDSYL